MIPEFIKALEAGRELPNPAMWKRLTELINITGVAIASIVELVRYFFPEILIPDGFSKHAAKVIGTGLFFVNLYFNRATTRKDISAAPIGGN